jgi:hypothetical protein
MYDKCDFLKENTNNILDGFDSSICYASINEYKLINNFEHITDESILDDSSFLKNQELLSCETKYKNNKHIINIIDEYEKLDNFNMQEQINYKNDIDSMSTKIKKKIKKDIYFNLNLEKNIVTILTILAIIIFIIILFLLIKYILPQNKDI